jgi:NADH-quinone oxidoreductase subunit F
VDLLLPPAPLNRAGYEAQGGYLALAKARADPAAARRVLLATGLCGRGGAGFPFARKLALALEGAERPRVVVCNAAEDEPGSLKDRLLLERNPHAVIEGALIAAAALGDATVILYVNPAALGYARQAAAQSGRPGLAVTAAPPGYVAGEASAAVSALNGGPAKPLVQPPYPTQAGVDGHPTLVANCETFANLPRIINGTAPVTRLATVSGDVAVGGVFEVDPATETFRTLIARAGGMAGGTPLKAIQPGGPATAFLTADALDVTLGDDSVAAVGSSAGCLAVRVYSTDRCMVEVTDEITRFFSEQQCGQCPPCRMKTQAYHRIIHQITTGHGRWDMLGQLSAVEEFVSGMPRRCSLIDMPTPPVASARDHFPADFAGHIDHQACPAGNSPTFPPLETGTAS